MVPLLLELEEPETLLLSALSSSSLQSEPAAECTSGVHYQLGRRRGNCCGSRSGTFIVGSDNSSKSGYYCCRQNSSRNITRKNPSVTMVITASTSLVTMAAAILMSCLFINVAVVEATDILSASSLSSLPSNNKFSFNSSSGTSGNSAFSSSSSSGKSSQNPYTHRFKGLDRILNRLDGNSGGSSGGSRGVATENTATNNADSSFSNAKDHFQPSNYQQQQLLQRRLLLGSTGSSSNSNGMSANTGAGSGGGGVSNPPSSSASHHHRSPISSFPPLSSLTGPGAGFKTPGKTYFDAGEDEDLDEEMDDDDSYEENEDDDESHDEELLNDKIANWAQSYKSRYLAQRKTAGTTTSSTTTTTTTTTPKPTTTTTTTTTTPPPISYSQWKWQNLGTRQGLEQYRRQMAGSTSGGINPSSSSINSNSIYPNGNGGSSSYHHRQLGHHHHHTNNNRYFGSSSNTNTHASPYSNNNNNGYSAGPVMRPSSHSSPSSSSSSQGKSWTGGSNNNRAQPQTPGAAISEAVRHALKVRKEASCSVPQPRVVRVQDFYPHPGKTYVPHCTILHQCSDDTGCCRHDTYTCSPKTTQRVELAFYTITLDQSRAPMVDRLVFYNHTECECRDKLDEMMPRDQQYTPSSSAPSSPASSPSSSLLTVASSSYLDPYSFPSGSVARKSAIIDSNSIDDHSQLQTNQCKCPSEFNERSLSDGLCSCDCFDKEKKCLRLKRGRDFFTLADKWCIQSGRCEVPECAYGPYIHLIGRCPRKRERSGQTTSWTRYLTS